ncbi:MAG TPA: oxidoreductase, partial [Actinobacteria bacterium]|nr:oxidoreductase [Actinomycetota bacterium]
MASMDSSDVRIALIGYGLAGSVFHAPLISTTPGMQLAAIVTGNADRVDLARRMHPGT